MTPCSAAAGGSFSSRESSRSAALRACSGSSAASICSRSSLTSACCSSPSPSSSWIAFSCWRRKNSRWPLSISGLHLRLDLGAELDDLELAGEDLGEAAQPGGDVDLLEQLLLLLGRDPQGAGDQVAERGGVVDVGDRHLQLLGQVGDLLDDLREGALDVAGQRLELGALLDHRRAARRSAPPGRAPRRRRGRAAPAGSPGRGCAACRRGPSACGRRRRPRRRRRGRRGRAPRSRGRGRRP